MTMVIVGDRIALSGKSLKGKNRVREFGTVWRVAQVFEGYPLFSPNECGPWLLVEAMRENTNERLMSTRWIHGMHDKDFFIERIM